MSKYRKRYKLRLTPLTPIHIGTGDEIDPLEYKIVAKKDGGKRLYRLNLPTMIESLSSQKRDSFLQLLDGNDMIKLRQFIFDNVDIQRHGFYDVVVNDSVYDVYQRKRSNQDNSLRINPMYRRLDTWQAVIPGSSIKGAIRTAVISQETKKRPDERDKKWEQKVLNATSPYDDPFRVLLIEDLTLPKDALIVAETVIISRNPEKQSADAGGIQQFYEVTFCYLDACLGEVERSELGNSCHLTFFPGLRQKINALNNSNIVEFDAKKIASCCQKFYRNKMENEHRDFYSKRKHETVHTVSEQLLNISYGELEFPIRLGHFSHCESTTIDNYRNPQTRWNKKTQSYLPWGTARTLAFGEFPMGWAKISLIPINDAEG